MELIDAVFGWYPGDIEAAGRLVPWFGVVNNGWKLVFACVCWVFSGIALSIHGSLNDDDE